MTNEELYKLDEDIRRRGQSLARLLLKRLSHVAKQHVSEARTLRLHYDGDTNQYMVARVTSHHNRTVWRLGKNTTLGDVFGVSASDVLDDVNHYVKLAGARLHTISDREHDGRPDLSVHLYHGSA